MSRSLTMSVLAGVLALLATPPGASAQTTERVSVDSAGNQGNGYPRPWTTHLDLALSADGSFVAFTSRSTNLVPGDTNGSPDVFVHDRRTGTTERVSVDSAGTEANARSYHPALSTDGRFVAFKSSATNLVPGDTNGADDVFVRDRQTGITERVSVASDGMQGNREAWFLGPPAISADGRFVAFISYATNLVPGDTNSAPDVFVHDRQTGATQRVSVDSAGNQWNTYFYYPALSADGRVVAFSRFRPLNYTFGSREDVYVHDRQTGTTELVGMNSAGGATLSADDRFVFGTWANADFGVPAPFVYDRQTGTTERVNVDGVHSAISLDFRFVAFTSYCGTIYGSECAPVPGDTNSASDVFVHDRQTGITERVSVASDGTQGDSGSYSPAISADGRIVAFISDATNLVPGDTNGVDDIFVHDRGAPEDRVATTVNFDTPAPPGGPGPLDGVFEGIDFGTGQWAWEGPFNVNPTNNIYFANSTGTSRAFAFSPAPRVLESLSVFSPSPGTLTLSDDTGQTLTYEVTTGSMQLVTTGWTQPTTTVTVSFSNGWDLGIDDVTSSPAP